MNQDQMTFLVSGTTSGLGKALAELLLSRGKTVIAVNRRRDETFSDHKTFKNFIVDIASTSEVTALLKDLGSRGIKVDTFILNAGVTEVDFEKTLDIEKFKLVLDTNLYGALSFVSAAQNLGLSKKRFAFISTTSVYVPNKGCLGYYVSKLALTKIRKLLQFGDTSNAYQVVILGPTLTNLNRNLPPLQGFAGKLFQALSQTPRYEAERILDFCSSQRKTLRPPLKTYLFYMLLRAVVFVFPGIYYKPNLPRLEKAQ